MTSAQRSVAFQLAAALRDALPAGTFDEASFVNRVLATEEGTGSAGEIQQTA